MEDKLVELTHAFRYSLRLSSRRMEDKLVELTHAFRYSLWLSSRRMDDKLVELTHAFRYSLRLSFCAKRRMKNKQPESRIRRRISQNMICLF